MAVSSLFSRMSAAAQAFVDFSFRFFRGIEDIQIAPQLRDSELPDVLKAEALPQQRGLC
ncbi:MAG: hypothetical protein RRY29_10225 [Desulfovibrionaceae bacterium]